MHLYMSAISRLNRIVLFMSGAILIGMMLLVTLDVASSYLLGRPIENVIEVVAFYFMVSIVFLPLGSAEFHDEHIKTDVLVQRLGRGARLVLALLTGSLTLITLVALVWVSIDKAIWATRQGEMMMGTTLIEIWPSRWILPIGFGLYLLGVIVVIAREVMGEPVTKDVNPGA